MFQETTTWDLRDMPPSPSTGMKLYMLFLLVACVVAGAKLLTAWRGAPPFRSARQANNPTYVASLQAASLSLKHWMGCIFLVWGIYASVHFYDACAGLLLQKTVGGSAIFFVVQDFAAALNMTLLVALGLFLVRWYLVRRIERLRPGTVSSRGTQANK
jgi:hypothetical protein